MFFLYLALTAGRLGTNIRGICRALETRSEPKGLHQALQSWIEHPSAARGHSLHALSGAALSDRGLSNNALSDRADRDLSHLLFLILTLCKAPALF